jgi:membrane-associated PAP2 superfamily phosphatase
MKPGDLKHIILSALIAFLSGMGLSFIWHSPAIILVAGLFAFSCGIAWELIQKFRGKHFSTDDLFFDFIGMVAGLGLLVMTLSIFEI